MTFKSPPLPLRGARRLAAAPKTKIRQAMPQQRVPAPGQADFGKKATIRKVK